MKWKSIDTLHQDIDECLVCNINVGYHICHAVRCYEIWCIYNVDGEFDEIDPRYNQSINQFFTHWMPVIEPPEKAEAA